MRPLLLCLAALSLLLAPAHAAELNGWAMGAFTDLSSADDEAELAAPIGESLAIGANLIELGRSDLGEFSRALGGQVQSAEGLSWTCFTFAMQGLRLVVAGEGPAPVRANFYAVEPLAAEADAAAGCTPAPMGEMLPLASLPLPVSPLKAVTDMLGAAAPDAAGRLVYNGEFAIEAGVELLQIRYRIDSNRAMALSVYRMEL